MTPSRIIASTAALTALTLLSGAGEPAPLPEVLGNLTCTLGDKVETDTGADAQKILCIFGRLHAGGQEVYEGTAYFVAGGAERNPADALSWIVKGPTTLLKAPGGLEQTYTQGTVESGQEGPLIGKDTAAVVLHPRGLAPAKDAAGAAPAASRASVIDLKLRTTTT